MAVAVGAEVPTSSDAAASSSADASAAPTRNSSSLELSSAGVCAEALRAALQQSCTTARAAPSHRRAPRVLCYGDSLTAGYTALTQYTGALCPWAPLLADALGVAIDHVGMCGWTSAQMLDGLDATANVDVCKASHRGLRRLLQDGGYTHVLLMAGTNDLKSRSASETAETLEALHGVCHAEGARTLALSIPHSKASAVGTKGTGARRREVNERLRAYAKASRGRCVHLSPAEEELVWEEGTLDFERDGLHLTRRGYERLASLLLRSGVRAFLEEHDDFVPALPAVSSAYERLLAASEESDDDESEEEEEEEEEEAAAEEEEEEEDEPELLLRAASILKGELLKRSRSDPLPDVAVRSLLRDSGL